MFLVSRYIKSTIWKYQPSSKYIRSIQVSYPDFFLLADLALSNICDRSNEALTIGSVVRVKYYATSYRAMYYFVLVERRKPANTATSRSIDPTFAVYK